ncbi:MAG: hypothetical protein ABH832_01055 [bacterium]
MHNNYTGVIVEESLEKKDVLEMAKIVKTKIEPVAEGHKTPWLKQWTLHTIEVPKKQAESMAKKISLALDSKYNWYADFKNHDFHYVIFHNKIFKVDRSKKEQYDKIVKYGLTLGIPDYQLDFSPDIKEWER